MRIQGSGGMQSSGGASPMGWTRLLRGREVPGIFLFLFLEKGSGRVSRRTQVPVPCSHPTHWAPPAVLQGLPASRGKHCFLYDSSVLQQVKKQQKRE